MLMLGADPRTLGLARLGLAAALLLDLPAAWPSRAAGEAAATGLLMGLRTRTCLLGSLAVLLLAGRADLLARLVVLGLFLPLARRFSVDAVVASLGARDERNADELAEPLPRDVAPHASLAVPLALAELALGLPPWAWPALLLLWAPTGRPLWDALERALRRVKAPRVVFYDAGCGVCHQAARLLLRLDWLGLLQLRPNDGRAPLPPGVDADLVERTIVVLDPASGRVTTRHHAFAAMALAMPLGWVPAALLHLPGPSQVAGAAYDWFAAHRRDISTWAGLAACGVPWAEPPRPAPRPPSPARRLHDRVRTALRELALAALAWYRFSP